MKHNLYNVEDRKYHYFYKITNNITGQYYFGIHSTNNLNDGYMGSGSSLRRAKKEYGKENFTKEIIKFFNTRDDASVYENEVVTQNVIDDVNCYNLRTGGDYGVCINTVLCFDIRTGEMLRCKRDDPCYLNGTYINFMKGRVPVYDNIEKINKVVSLDEFYSHKDIYTTPGKNKLVAKDEYDNRFYIDINDPRFLNGELIPLWKGKKHSESTKQKISLIKKGTGVGEKNSQYQTCWIYKDNENKKIKIKDLQKYINDGWVKGRKCPELKVLKILKDIDPNVIYEEKINGMTWEQLSIKYRCGKNTILRYLKRNNLIK